MFEFGFASKWNIFEFISGETFTWRRMRHVCGFDLWKEWRYCRILIKKIAQNGQAVHCGCRMFNTSLLYQNTGQPTHFDWWRWRGCQDRSAQSTPGFIFNKVKFIFIAFPSHIWHSIHTKNRIIYANNPVDCAVELHRGHGTIRQYEHGQHRVGLWAGKGSVFGRSWTRPGLSNF